MADFVEDTAAYFPNSFLDANMTELFELFNSTAQIEFIECELKKNSTILIQNYCPVHFDTVLCWPQTAPNESAILPCFEHYKGIKYNVNENASRFCFANGSWGQYSNYTSCNELLPEVPEIDNELTTTIYLVGYTLSLIALLIAIYIFLNFKDLRCLRNTIHMNLMCSYILENFMWILVYTLQGPLQANHAFCVFLNILIILLHYFHLTNFFWMFVEGLYLYILVVKTFSGENIKSWVYATIGWGAPVIIVLIWACTIPFEDLQSGDGYKSCSWSPAHFDWTYLGPAIAVLLINLLFLCVIMWVLITKLRSANNVETQQYRKAAKALLVLIPLLGVTYILVIAGPTEGIPSRIYDSIRAILLSTQGFTVALFYCFLNAEVKNTVRHHYNSWHTRRTLSSRRTRYSASNWSTQARDSMRLCQTNSYRKRGSTCSTGTTTTVVVVPLPKQPVKALGSNELPG